MDLGNMPGRSALFINWYPSGFPQSFWDNRLIVWDSKKKSKHDGKVLLGKTSDECGDDYYIPLNMRVLDTVGRRYNAIQYYMILSTLL